MCDCLLCDRYATYPRLTLLSPTVGWDCCDHELDKTTETQEINGYMEMLNQISKHSILRGFNPAHITEFD